ncbi:MULTISPECIES: hypothetical protein [unclassified Thermosynechococcus]|uniref:hypothetical protein n=1 Tax=unclassified Thermosynechococcus TaxID=2622553 RepID=UPI0019DC9779|nr:MULTISPECIES: hypothetical protein [unclassified Thermosynechococcus]HIK36133.1 hypothetical protein [Thermosynechococcus sp. M98_K2018_005]HIK47372.1 hypothetical protein [Thermosynechococcus sp. M55_K2018_012]
MSPVAASHCADVVIAVQIAPPQRVHHDSLAERLSPRGTPAVIGSKELHATYAIAFPKGLESTGNTPEQVTERLCRQGVEAAHVQASASIAT